MAKGKGKSKKAKAKKARAMTPARVARDAAARARKSSSKAY